VKTALQNMQAFISYGFKIDHIFIAKLGFYSSLGMAWSISLAID